MKRASKIELSKELVRKSYLSGNWECGCEEDGGMYYNNQQLVNMVCDGMSKAMIKRVINQKLELYFEFCDYRNSSGNLCGRYEELYLYVNDEYYRTLYSTYDEAYEREWCK